MRFHSLWSVSREGWASARRQPVASLVTGLIAAGVSASIVATIGQSQAAGNRIIERIDEVGTREIRLIDDTGSGGLGEDAVERVAALSGVEWAIGLGPVRDVQVPVLRMSDAPVPSRTVFGRPPPAIEVSSRWPDPGEAVVGARASDVLGLVDASGTVVGYPAAPIAIVGSMTVVEPVEELAGHVLVAPTDDDDDVRTVIVIVRSADEVADVAAAVLDVAGASDPSAVRVETSEALAGLRAQVDDELHRYGSGLLVSTLAAGLALTSVTSFGAVAARRRDFGRRRALGCSRSLITLIVILQTVLPALVGAVTGTCVAWWRISVGAGSGPSAGFVAAVVALAVMASAVAAVVPAVLTSFRDPIAAVRVP